MTAAGVLVPRTHHPVVSVDPSQSQRLWVLTLRLAHPSLPHTPQGWTALTLWLQAMPGSFCISVLRPLWAPIRDHLFSWLLTVLTPAPALHTRPTPHTPHMHPHSTPPARPHCAPRPGRLCSPEGMLRCWVSEQVCNRGGMADYRWASLSFREALGREALPPPLPGES